MLSRPSSSSRLVRRKPLLQVAAHDDLARLRLESRIRRGAPGAALHGAELQHLVEERAVSGEVGIVLGEADMDVGHSPVPRPRRPQRVAAGREEGVGLRRVALERERDLALAMADVVLEMKGDERVSHVLSSRFNEDWFILRRFRPIQRKRD